jgi:hypothetical protein
MATATLEREEVSKKASKKSATGSRQINVRFPVELADRIDKTAAMLATDASHLLRMLVAEMLPIYEERARKARGSPRHE